MIDGTYSFVAASVAGCSSAIMTFSKGTVEGTDIAGGRYSGTYVEQDDQTVNFDLTITMPPGLHGIFGSSETETFQSLRVPQVVPVGLFTSDETFVVPSYGITLLARRIPDDYAPYAGPDGIDHYIRALSEAKVHWQRHLASV